MLSSLPCFYACCWSAIPTSCYIFNVFYSCINKESWSERGDITKGKVTSVQMQDILCYQCIASDNLSFWTVQLSSIYLMSASQVSAWQWTQLPLIINLLCISNSRHPLAASSCHGNALPSPGQLPVCCVFWQLDPSEPPTCVCVCAYVYMSVSKKGVITNYSFSHALVYKSVIIHKSGTCNKALTSACALQNYACFLPTHL